MARLAHIEDKHRCVRYVNKFVGFFDNDVAVEEACVDERWQRCGGNRRDLRRLGERVERQFLDMSHSLVDVDTYGNAGAGVRRVEYADDLLVNGDDECVVQTAVA